MSGEFVKPSERIPTVETPRGTLIPICFTDIDGTAIDETLPENQRITTIEPARAALRTLEKNGVLAGTITGRAVGEALTIHKELKVSGVDICEDGAVVVLPAQTRQDLLPKDWQVVSHRGRLCVVLSQLNKEKMQAFLEEVQSKLDMVNPKNSTHLITSINASPEEVMKHIRFPTREAASDSMDRLASALVIDPNSEQLEIIGQLTPKYNIRTFARPLHLIGEDADKGRALHFLDEHANMIFSGIAEKPVQGILPIGFGNNVNDLKIFNAIEALGGKGVIVAHPNGGYFVNESDIPSSVIKATKPYGYGIEETVPQVLAWFQSLKDAPSMSQP